jgi:uncharacterized protein (TIGR00730 family)
MTEKMPELKKAPAVAVYCSANPGLDAQIIAEAKLFAQGLASRGWQLIYGGAAVGLMGAFADECIKHGGVARGSITRDLAKGAEVAHRGLQELVMVDSLFERKRWMMDEADAFVIFPGGFGTLDEALEAITWKSLGCLDKPIVFVNIDGFWQTLLNAFADLASRGVIRPGGLDLYEVVDSTAEVWSSLEPALRK